MTIHELVGDVTNLREGLDTMDYLVLEARLSVLQPIDDDPVEEISNALGRIGSALQGRREVLNVLIEKMVKEGINSE